MFVRVAGCPLRCTWCDTKYAWDSKAGQDVSCEQILKKISEYPTRYVVLTGGEPMLYEGISELAEAIHSKGFHLTIETAGTNFVAGLPVDLMSISPKLSNAELQEDVGQKNKWLDVAVLSKLISAYNYQLKFVVDKPKDLDEIAAVLTQLDSVDIYKIYLMPQATRTQEYLEKSRWLIEYCKQTGFSFSPRLQVMLWDSQRGK